MTEQEVTFAEVKPAFLKEWETATTRDAGLNVLTFYGQKVGYRNVMAWANGRESKAEKRMRGAK